MRKYETKTDWRTNYIICEHLADNADLPCKHRGFRVCCEACYAIEDDRGVPRFLYDEDIEIEERANGLAVGSI